MVIRFCFLLQLLLFHSSWGQLIEKPNIQLITIEDGLPVGTTNLIQNKAGYVWIATTDGLYRYDGYSFIRINFNKAGGYALPNEVILSLAEDKKGNIWLGHMSGFITRFNPKTLLATSYRTNPILTNDVNKIFCDDDDNIYASLLTQGLFQFNGKDKFDFIGNVDQLPQKSLREPKQFNAINSFYSQDDKLWLGTANGLQYFDKKERQLVNVDELNTSNAQDPYSVQSVTKLNDSVVWCATYGDGLFSYNIKSGKQKKFHFQSGSFAATNVILAMIPKSANELWIATSGRGLGKFNTDTEEFTFYYEIQGIDTGPITSAITRTQNGMLLVLSDRGMYKWDYEQEGFIFYKVPVERSYNAAYYMTQDVLERKTTHDIYIGLAYANGIAIQSPGQPIKYRGFDYHPKSDPFQITNDIMEDSKGSLWVVTRDYLYKVDHNDQLVKDIPLSNQFKKNEEPLISKIIESTDGSLWVSSVRHGAYRRDPITLSWNKYSTENNAMASDRILDMEADTNGNVWFLHHNSGVSVYNTRQNSFVHYRHNHSNPNSLIGERVTDITMAANGAIWISTLEGVSEFHSETNTFSHYTNKTGLPTNNVYSIEVDEHDNVWLITSVGVSVIMSDSKEIRNFDFLDGLKDISSNLKIKKGINGKMFITAFQGFYIFYPVKLLTRNRTSSPIVITGIDHPDEKISGIQHRDEISIPYDKNNIQIEFASLNYFNTQQNKYLFKMEGLDKDWNSTSFHHVKYSGLPSGNYTFKVRNLADPETIVTTLQIEITTPFWRQPSFLLFWFILLLGSGYWIYRMRLRNLREEVALKAEFKQKLAEVEMKALRSQMSPHFIFNSLNSINRYIIKSDPDTASTYLTKFSKLIRLILDNSNHKVISLEQELLAIKLYIELEALRFNQKFSYSLWVDPALNPLSIGVPPMIIQPFVENAIWHGLLHKESPGELTIKVERFGHGIQCIIEDNGIGRAKAKELRSKSVSQEKSYGMKITADRLTMLNNDTNVSSVEILDMIDAHGNASGTRVIVRIMATEIEPEF